MYKSTVILLFSLLFLTMSCQKEDLEPDQFNDEITLRGESNEEDGGGDGDSDGDGDGGSDSSSYDGYDGDGTTKGPKQPDDCVEDFTGLRVLFIGNSYTANYTVDIPTMFAELAAESGHVGVVVETSAQLGQNLTGHLSSSTTNSLIDQGNWDYVVLQENASALANGGSGQFTNAVSSFVDLIDVDSPDAKILLYQVVPAYEHTSATYSNLNNTWDALFTSIASSHANVTTTRVAQAFTDAYFGAGTPGIHPTFGDVLRQGSNFQYHFRNTGGFLAAVTFYADIFNDKPCVPSQMTFSLGGGNTGVGSTAMYVSEIEEILQIGYLQGYLSSLPSQEVGCPLLTMMV